MSKFQNREGAASQQTKAPAKGPEQKVKIIIEGTGYGLQFREEIGVLRFEVFVNQRRARVFFEGHTEGIPISTENLSTFGHFKSEIKVQASIKRGGDFDAQNLDTVRAWLQTLRQRCLESYLALIHVHSAGQHSSPLAGKVKLTRADGSTTTKIVPASCVDVINGRLYIPLWLAKKKAGSSMFKGDRRLPPVVEAALSKLDLKFELSIIRLNEIAAPLQSLERIEAPRRALRMDEENAQKKVLAEEKEAARRLHEAQYKEEEKKRLHEKQEKFMALPLHAINVTIKGSDWSRKSGQAIKTPWIKENATVRLSGTRAYIFTNGQPLPDFWKPLKTIQIIQTDSHNDSI